MDRPTKGYKAVIRYTEFRWYIPELDIPMDATVVHSGGGFYRADKVVPVKFWSSQNSNLMILDPAAHAWFNKDFPYNIGYTSKANLDPNPHTDCAEGIHFFATREQAINWGKANFGINAAM
jgi:hypothetical protein